MLIHTFPSCDWIKSDFIRSWISKPCSIVFVMHVRVAETSLTLRATFFCVCVCKGEMPVIHISEKTVHCTVRAKHMSIPFLRLCSVCFFLLMSFCTFFSSSFACSWRFFFSFFLPFFLSISIQIVACTHYLYVGNFQVNWWLVQTFNHLSASGACNKDKFKVTAAQCVQLSC